LSRSSCEWIGASTDASARRSAPASSGRISALVGGSSYSPSRSSCSLEIVSWMLPSVIDPTCSDGT
jgi:hypothetical protein